MFSKDQLQVITQAIDCTWGALSADVEADGNEDAMEMCLDAGRLKMYGGGYGDEADTLVHNAVKKHGWIEVLNFLCDKVYLV